MEFGERREGFRVVRIGFHEFFEDLDGVRFLAHLRIKPAEHEFGVAVVAFSREVGEDARLGGGVFLPAEMEVGDVEVEREVARLDGEDALEGRLGALVIAERPLGGAECPKGDGVLLFPFQGGSRLFHAFLVSFELHVQAREPRVRLRAVRRELHQFLEFHQGVGEVSGALEQAFEVDNGLHVTGVRFQGLSVIPYRVVVPSLIGEDDAHVVAGFRVEGIDGEDTGEYVHRLGVAAALELDDAEIIHRLEPARFALERRLVLPGGIFQASDCLERYAVVEMEGRIVAVQQQALLEDVEGFIPLPEPVVHRAQVVVRGDVIGIEFDHLRIGHGSGLQVAELLVDVAKVIVEFRLGGIGLYGAFKRVERVAELLAPAVDHRQIVQGFRVGGVA